MLLTWKDCHEQHDQERYQAISPRDFILVSKVNFNSLRLSGDIQSPGMTLAIITFQRKTRLINPHLKMGAIINRTDSCWICSKKHVSMKIILTH